MKLTINKDTIQWKEVAIFLFFMALAFGFWLLQYSNDNGHATLLNHKSAVEVTTTANHSKSGNTVVKSEEMTEKTFELPLVCHNLPTDLRVRFFPSTVTITCRLTVTEYGLLSEKDLEIGLDYYDVMQKTETLVAPVVFQKPEWLKEYKIVPETVEYLIEEKHEL
jgi:hypothetical protein